MKIAPDEIRGQRPNPIFASRRDALNPFTPAPPGSCNYQEAVQSSGVPGLDSEI